MRQRSVWRLATMAVGLAVIAWRMAGTPQNEGEEAAVGTVAAELQRAASKLRGAANGPANGPGVHRVAGAEPEQPRQAPQTVTVVRGR